MEAIRVPSSQLLLVSHRHPTQRNADGVCRDGKAPERIAKLVDHGVAIEHPTLKHVPPGMGEDFTSLFGQARCGIEKSVRVVQGWIDRPGGRHLVRVEGALVLATLEKRTLGLLSHAYVTRGSAFA